MLRESKEYTAVDMKFLLSDSGLEGALAFLHVFDTCAEFTCEPFEGRGILTAKEG